MATGKHPADIYVEGQKVIVQSDDYYQGMPLEGIYQSFAKASNEHGFSLHKVQITAPRSKREITLGYFSFEVSAA